MNRGSLIVLSLAAALAAASCERASPPPETTAALPPSPAAATRNEFQAEPGEIIEARRLLMLETERLMKPIDGYTIGEPVTPAELRSLATTLEPMLLALPHLFPASTDLFDPAVLDPPTIALPAIWQRFPAFRAMAVNAEHAAAQLRAASDDPQALKAASERLRTSCDACHRAFTQAYTPPVVTDADLTFDFESALPPQ